MDQLIIEQLHFSFGKQVLIEDVSLVLQSGKFYVLEGDNGTGKSTLLKILVGLTAPQQGSVSFNATNLTRMNVRERSRLISYMPSRREHSGNLDVETAVTVGQPNSTIIQVQDVLEKFELQDKRHRLLTQLSDGEYQRLQLARVCLQNTPVVILDEPTAHLDAKWRERFFKMLKQWAEDEQKIILASSHDLFLNNTYAHERISWPLVPLEGKKTH